jgi:hypothetical protein
MSILDHTYCGHHRGGLHASNVVKSCEQDHVPVGGAAGTTSPTTVSDMQVQQTSNKGLLVIRSIGQENLFQRDMVVCQRKIDITPIYLDQTK